MRFKVHGLLVTATILLAISPEIVTAATPLEARTEANLSFGRIVSTPSPGTVTVAPSGLRTSAGGVVLGNGFGASAASFAVTGEPNSNYSLILPGSCVLTGGGDSILADGFTSSIGGSGNLGPTGRQSVALGAVLHIGPTQRAAEYAGTYFIAVAYE